MSIISANTLFHFTRSRDVLLKILEGGFRAIYCRELGKSTLNTIVESYIPMVCFCDLPLSSIEKNTNEYSWQHNGKTEEFNGYVRFGIGLSKEWGEMAKLNPITYVTNNSYYLDHALAANSANSILAHGNVWEDLGMPEIDEIDATNIPTDVGAMLRLKIGYSGMLSASHSLFSL